MDLSGIQVMKIFLIIQSSVIQIVRYSDHGFNNGHYQASENQTKCSAIQLVI